jgi:hypothetical protein
MNLVKQNDKFQFKKDLFDYYTNFYDYDFYLPDQIFSDLINLCSFYYIDGNINNAFNDIYLNQFKTNLKNLYLKINYGYFQSNNIIKMSLNILEDLSKTVNLRKLNSEISSFYENESLSNFKEEIKSDLKFLFHDLDYSNIIKLLKLKNQIKSNLHLKSNNLIESSKMKNISQINKIKKSQIKRPNFISKLSKKDFYFKNNSKNKEIIIIMEDCSNSMSEELKNLICKAIKLIILDIEKEIHYFEYSGSLIKKYILSSNEEKIEFINKPKKYYNFNNNYSFILNKILNDYNKGEVFIITDGNDFLPEDFKCSLKINSIITRPSKSFLDLSKKHNGKSIIING